MTLIESVSQIRPIFPEAFDSGSSLRAPFYLSTILLTHSEQHLQQPWLHDYIIGLQEFFHCHGLDLGTGIPDKGNNDSDFNINHWKKLIDSPLMRDGLFLGLLSGILDPNAYTLFAKHEKLDNEDFNDGYTLGTFALFVRETFTPDFLSEHSEDFGFSPYKVIKAGFHIRELASIVNNQEAVDMDAYHRIYKAGVAAQAFISARLEAKST